MLYQLVGPLDKLTLKLLISSIIKYTMKIFSYLIKLLLYKINNSHSNKLIRINFNFSQMKLKININKCNNRSNSYHSNNRIMKKLLKSGQLLMMMIQIQMMSQMRLTNLNKNYHLKYNHNNINNYNNNKDYIVE